MEEIGKFLKDILIKVAEMQKVKQYELVVNTEPLKSEGFLSDLYMGIVKNKNNKPDISVAVKRVPRKKGVFQEYTALYINEVNIYSKIFPELDTFQKKKGLPKPFNNIPKYFCSGLDHENEYIAMENLKDLGYCLLNKKECFDEQHLNICFEAFGKFHALSFAFKDQHLDKYNEMLKSLVNVFENITEDHPILESMESSVVSGLKAFDNLNDANIANKLKKMENVKKLLLDGMNYQGQYRCITHGDCWSNNMLFKHDGSGIPIDVKFVDFQMARETTPLMDLLFFFYSSGSGNDFKKLDLYLEKYYNGFATFTKELGSDPDKVYPWNAVKNEWKQHAIVGALLGIDLWIPKLMDNQDILELRNNDDKKEEKLKIWEKELDKVRKSEIFKDRTRQIILHLIEYNIL